MIKVAVLRYRYRAGHSGSLLVGKRYVLKEGRRKEKEKESKGKEEENTNYHQANKLKRVFRRQRMFRVSPPLLPPRKLDNAEVAGQKPSYAQFGANSAIAT